MRVEVKQTRSKSGYCFYLWKGMSLISAKYDYASAKEAATAGYEELEEFRAIKKMKRQHAWWKFW